MSESEVLKAQKRTQVGTRPARRLRMDGRIPASIPAHGDGGHVDLHVSEHDFLATRRHHTHLYEIDVEGTVETAVVRELQWDTFGEHILHIEFKRVRLGEETESEVELEFAGTPKGGLINHLVTHVTIRSVPTKIPDSIEVKVGHLVPGDTVSAGQLELPEGVSLVTEADTMVAVVVVPRADTEEPAEAEGTDAGTAGTASAPPAAPE
jgi:large subunit ribosomal protein L25